MFVKVKNLEQQRAQSALFGVEARAGVRARVLAWVKKAGPVFALAALLAVCVPGVARGAVETIRVNPKGKGTYVLNSSHPYFKNDGTGGSAGDYNLYFDYAAQTLTMKDLALEYDLAGGEHAGIQFHEGYGSITIILEGNNTIVSRTDPGNSFDIGIKNTDCGTTTIKGSGTLTIEAGAGTTWYRHGIEAGDLIMMSGVVHATGGAYGVEAHLIMNGGQFTGVGETQGISGFGPRGQNIKLWAGTDENDALSRDGQSLTPSVYIGKPYISLRESYELTVTGGTKTPNFQWFWLGRDATVTADDTTQFSRWEVVDAPVGFALQNPRATANSFAMPAGNVSLRALHKPTSLTLNASTLPIVVGNTQALAVATATPANADKDVTWQSSNPNVATVDTNGNVTAVALGTAIITATSTAVPTVFATCNVTVINPPPKTGDPAPLGLWAMLGLLSLACAATFLHRMRKQA